MKPQFRNTATAVLLIALLAADKADAKSPNAAEQIDMVVTFTVKPDAKARFKQALLDDLKNARKESGNVLMELYEAKDNPNTLYFYERWKNQAALDAHFEQPYVKAVLELSKTALTTPMQITYIEDLAPLGIERIARTLTGEEVDLFVFFEVKDGEQERFKKQFEKSVKNSRPEAGCIAFHIHKVKGNETQFVLYERWKNQTAFDFHLAQSYTKELFEMFKIALAKPVDQSLVFLKDQVKP